MTTLPSAKFWPHSCNESGLIDCSWKLWKQILAEYEISHSFFKLIYMIAQSLHILIRSEPLVKVTK